MYIIRLSALRQHSDALFPAVTAVPAPPEDYPKLYGKDRSNVIRHKFDLNFMLFRLYLQNEESREEIELFFKHNNLGVATSCNYCRTFDWDKHQEHCPIDTPEDSPERQANKKGEADGRKGNPAADPDSPVYMLGHNWGIDCKKYWERQRRNGD